MQLPDDGRLSEQFYEVNLLLPLFLRVMLCDVHVGVVVLVDMVDHRLVDRPSQECFVPCCYKSATTMCV